MARFCGEIGYAIPTETSPGVWEDGVTVKKTYKGEVIRSQQRWVKSENVLENLDLDNSISIIADDFAFLNISYMKYVTLNGQKWKIKSIIINRPRIILQIGGVYNG
jgi:hypothetical protein